MDFRSPRYEYAVVAFDMLGLDEDQHVERVQPEN